MSNLLKKLGLSAVVTAAGFAVVIAQSTQAATVNFSYTQSGQTSPTLFGSFSYADDNQKSEIFWEDLTDFVATVGNKTWDLSTFRPSLNYFQYFTEDVVYPYSYTETYKEYLTGETVEVSYDYEELYKKGSLYFFLWNLDDYASFRDHETEHQGFRQLRRSTSIQNDQWDYSFAYSDLEIHSSSGDYLYDYSRTSIGTYMGSDVNRQYNHMGGTWSVAEASDPTSVPEPGIVAALMGLGLSGLFMKKKASSQEAKETTNV